MSYIQYAPEYIFVILVLFVWSYKLRSKNLAIFTSILLCVLLYFFREWSSDTPADPNILYSPCDGVVSEIINKDGMTQVCIFLNIHNIHAQYSPFECTVKSVTHKEGTFHPAYLTVKSQYNERTEYILENNVFGTVKLVQIAGQLARRIVTFVEEGDKLSAFSPIGLIKLGSRCDIYSKNKLLVKKGDRVHIGDPLFSV